MERIYLFQDNLNFSQMNNINNVPLGSSEEGVNIILFNDSFVVPYES